MNTSTTGLIHKTGALDMIRLMSGFTALVLLLTGHLFGQPTVTVTRIDSSLNASYHWFIPGSDVSGANKVYVFGTRTPTGSSLVQGTDTIFTFDLGSRVWTKLPFRLPYVNVDAGVTGARVGNSFFVPPGFTTGDVNGWGSKNGIIKVDLLAGTANVVAQFPFPAIWNIGNCVANGKVYFFGGHTGIDQRGIFEFNPATNSLVRVAEMVQAAARVTPTLSSNGWIYYWSPVSWSVPVQRFHPSTHWVEQLSANNPAQASSAIQKWYIPEENSIYFLPDEESPARLFKYDINADMMANTGILVLGHFSHISSVQDASDPRVIYSFQKNSSSSAFPTVLSRLELSQTTGVDQEEMPAVFSLSHNYPNPFNPSTKIKFALPKSGNVSLKVYNPLGQEVTTLVDQELTPGVYEETWNATGTASGVYFYRLRAGDFVETKRMLLLK